MVGLYVPEARPVLDAAWTAFGGRYNSESADAIDRTYLLSIYTGGLTHPIPSKEVHLKYLMTQRLEIPVQSCSDGTALVVICPYFAC